MSVDYRAKIIVGVPIDIKYQDIINEITNYEYEDWFHLIDYYREVDTVIFGKCIAEVGEGLFKQIPYPETEELDFIGDKILYLLEKCDYPDFYEVYHNITEYFACEVS
jgi:hypothetical protein